MTKTDSLATTIALISLLIAFAALMISWKAMQIQRAEHKLNLAAAQEKARLRAVESFFKDKRRQLGMGFRIRNGPDTVTVTRAAIHVTYTIFSLEAFLLQDERFICDIQSEDFGVLGITGPEFAFRLDPNHEVEWRFPYSASFRLPEIQEANAKSDRYQQIEFIFSVTASGNRTTSSKPFILGHVRGNKPWFGYRRDGEAIFFMESFILGAIARRVLQSTGSTHLPSPVQDELKGLAGQGYVQMPAGLQEWLLDSWQQAGKFSDESTEELARMLVELCPPDRDPDLLKAFAQDSIEEQSRSRESNTAETIETDTKSRQGAPEGTMPDSADSDLLQLSLRFQGRASGTPAPGLSPPATRKGASWPRLEA
jgi:hypothetical protein